MSRGRATPRRPQSPMHTQPIAGALALLCLAACGDLEVRRETAPEAVPSQLRGEWGGTWRSSLANRSGGLTIRIQEFDQQPVVSLQIDNPCLVPRAYDLVLSGGAIALRADGEQVLVASLTGERRLDGTYGCDADSGTWSAEWRGELPEPVDLGGLWTGELVVTGGVQRELRVTLDQVVRGGALVVEGFAALPEVLPFPIPVSGVVAFGEDDFDLVMQSFEPRTVWSAEGTLEPARIDLGLVQVLGAPGLPFTQALFELERQPE